MGRKIKGKKHRGVKDPREQAERKLNSISSKINCPPSHADEQEIPQRLLEIMEFQKNPIEFKKKKKNKKNKVKLLSTVDFLPKEGDVQGAKRQVKCPETVTQLPGENKHKFLYRVDQSFKQSLREAYFEDKFGVQVKRDPQTREVIGVIKDRKSEVDAIIKESIASTLPKKKRKKMIPALSKCEKKRAKLLAKMEIKNEKEVGRDFSEFRDEIKFGEIVHRPPKLTVLPRMKIKNSSGVLNPGKKNLLLKAVLEGAENKQKVSLNFKTKNKTSEVSMTRKKMLEEERERVVQLYRIRKGKIE